MKWLAYCAAMLLGLLLGKLISPAPPAAPENLRTREAHRSASRSMPAMISRVLESECPSMNQDVSYKDAARILREKKRSPIRTRAFLGHRIHLMSRDDLVSALGQGEIRTAKELAEAARRLVTEDREGTFDLYEKYAFSYGGMDNYYAFSNSMLRTWVREDAPSLFVRLKKLKRGGGQQDNSLRFSQYWAEHDPAEAVKHYHELVHLRNMRNLGSIDLTDDAFAKQLIRSWNKKDPQSMRDYIEKLPQGRKKRALENAMIRQVKKQPAH